MICKICKRRLHFKDEVLPVDASEGEESKEWIHFSCQGKTEKKEEVPNEQQS